MKIYRNFDNLSGRFTACIGFFDGVHVGHRFLLAHVRAEAAQAGTCSAAITFVNHPRRLVQPDYDLPLIDTLDERLRKLDATGLDACFLLDFTEQIRQLTAEAFLRDVVARRLHVVRLLIGYDHRFGRDRAEGFDDYVRYGRECSVEVVREPVFGDFAVSSSEVRRALADGEVARVARLLSVPYSMEGRVVSGHQLGRRLGFPTANLQPVCADKVVPAVGVYAVWADLQDGRRLPAMLNIGHRPTVDADSGQKITLEAHVIGFEGNLYGQRMTLSFVTKIRDEQRMPSLEALCRQLAADRQAALRVLAGSGGA